MLLSLPKWFPLFILASSVCRSLQCLISALTRGGEGHLFSRAVGREEHCKQISLACVGSAHSVSVALGLPPLMACVLSQTTLLSLQVALQGNCLKQSLGFVHFPGLSHSGSGSQVLHKGTDLAGPAFCALPRSGQLRRSGAWQAHTAQVGSASYRLPHPSCSVSWVHSRTAVSGVLCVSSGELISGCSPPGRCQPSRIPGRLG